MTLQFVTSLTIVTTQAPPPSLRAEHMEHTRERLLQAAIDVILEEGAELSLRDVAAKAGVSAPTAYRHFPTKGELLEEVIGFIDRQMNIPVEIHTVDDYASALPVIHRSFQENARFMAAYVRARAATDLRLAGRRNRSRRTEHAVRGSFPAMPDETARALGAVLQLFASSTSWELWRSQWGLEGERAGHVAAWTVKTIEDAVRRDPAAFARAAAGGTPPEPVRESKSEPPATGKRRRAKS